MPEKNPFDRLFEGGEDGDQYARPRNPERPAPEPRPAPGQPRHSGTAQGYPDYPAQGYPYPVQGDRHPTQGYPAPGYHGVPAGQQHPQPYYGDNRYGHGPYVQGYQKSRMAAGLLGVFLGGFGVHRFYLGSHGIGVAQLLLTVFTGTGAIWGLVEGIMILCNARTFHTDAKGIPLR